MSPVSTHGLCVLQFQVSILARACRTAPSRPKCRVVNSAFSENSDQRGFNHIHRMFCHCSTYLQIATVKSFTSRCAYIYMTQINSSILQSLSKCLTQCLSFKAQPNQKCSECLRRITFQWISPSQHPRGQRSHGPHHVLPWPGYGGCRSFIYMTYFMCASVRLVKEGRQKLNQKQKKTYILYYLLWLKILFVSMSQSLNYCPAHHIKNANLLLYSKMRGLTITLKTFTKPKDTLEKIIAQVIMVFSSSILLVPTRKHIMYSIKQFVDVNRQYFLSMNVRAI